MMMNLSRRVDKAKVRRAMKMDVPYASYQALFVAAQRALVALEDAIDNLAAGTSKGDVLRYLAAAQQLRAYVGDT